MAVKAMDGTATEKGKSHTLYYHKMGTAQIEDVIVAQFPHEPEWMMLVVFLHFFLQVFEFLKLIFCSDGEVSEDGRFLIVGVSAGCDPHNLLYYVDLKHLGYTIKGKNIFLGNKRKSIF
jgi:prolyl oligopeptidase